jgi:TonB-linked SusC/RagA family outer membrane protein
MRKKITRLFACLVTLLFFHVALAQNQRVTGTVLDQSGAGIAGVTVAVKGTNIATQTDTTGAFSINAPANGTLVFSSVGYATQEVPIQSRTSITAALVRQGTTLNEVVVVGYGTQRKIDVTGSVAQVKGDEIAKQPATNPVSALQGKVAGVQITNSGAPGASPQIRIRGVGTLYGSATPLYVVDGVWFDDISFLNPGDIESINILKDASSEAIYGVRAANGVVLVTTKRGRGRATVSYNGYVGVQRVTDQVEMANATEYATLINEMNVGQGSAAPFADPASYGEGTDWFDVILRNAFTTNHHVSIAGGSERTTYNFSVGYLKQEGIVEGNDYSRFTARLQNDIQVTKFLKLGYTGVFEGSHSNDIPGGFFYKAFTAAPVVPVKYADGSWGDPNDYPIGTATNNPALQLEVFDQESRNYRGIGNIFGEITFNKNLNFRSSAGGEFGQGEVSFFNPVYYNPFEHPNSFPQGNTIQFNDTSLYRVTRAEVRNWIVENTLTYDQTFDDHKLKVLVGQSAQRYKSYRLVGTAEHVPNEREGDRYIRLGINSSTRPNTITDEGALSTYNSYFGRINYSFRNRYLLTASLRADGSSKFEGDERWGHFPSIGVGWIISDENFMNNQQLFDNLKLRGSWGKVGNASVPANLAVQTVDRRGQLTGVFGGQPAPGASITTIVPPTIFWERGVGTDIGVEGAVLDNRLTFELDWYNRVTEDAIFNIPVLRSLGLSNNEIRGNQADIQNRGFEFSLGWRNKSGNDLSYSINGNMSINDNEVLEVVTGENPIYGGGAAATGGALATRTIEGQPIGQFFGYQVDGIFQTDAEAASSGLAGAKAGDFRYVDQNKDAVVDDKDRVVIGNPNAKYTFGLNTNFLYKSFDFTLDFQGVAGVDVYNANKGLRFGSENFSKDFYDNRWHGEGTSNEYPSANVGGRKNYLPNSWFVEDGSYVRVRNIQLGYTLPNTLTSKWGLNRIRVYVNAQNALNFFSYTGFTPEIGAISDPNIVGPLNTGIDNGIYPLSATYNFGVNISF